mgnify:CR=1 FL=1|tara:strand:+ start:189 stop:464 length:276 start_codon:yes stop_codon:yes gene_type:complete
MKYLPLAPKEYNQTYQTELNTIVTELDANMMKLDAANFLVSRTDSSGNIEQTGALVLQSPNGTFYKLAVANNGTISTSVMSTDQSSNPYVT